MKPALTPEEWANPRIDIPDGSAIMSTEKRHALGALALYNLTDADGRPLGFTRQMLAALDAALRYDMTPEDVDECRAMRSIIEALLPPEML